MTTGVLYGLLADLVVVAHVGFILFVAVGALFSWRWPRLLAIHVPAVVYAAVIVTVGFDCPLTAVEKYFRRLAGQHSYRGGFVNHYLADVVYPGRLTTLLRVVAAACIALGYGGLFLKWRRRTKLAQVVRS
ncbi:MAG TPA: DUF2784 domain-containing protein [Acidimicrobiales bacterium]|nr:DUF2784 domain-containing protein [Acidimicrobiales bacterium]